MRQVRVSLLVHLQVMMDEVLGVCVHRNVVDGLVHQVDELAVDYF